MLAFHDPLSFLKINGLIIILTIVLSFIPFKKLRKNKTFAAEYLKAAMEDTEEQQSLLVGFTLLS
jgi:hypothetical protein